MREKGNRNDGQANSGLVAVETSVPSGMTRDETETTSRALFSTSGRSS